MEPPPFALAIRSDKIEGIPYCHSNMRYNNTWSTTLWPSISLLEQGWGRLTEPNQQLGIVLFQIGDLDGESSKWGARRKTWSPFAITQILTLSQIRNFHLQYSYSCVSLILQSKILQWERSMHRISSSHVVTHTTYWSPHFHRTDELFCENEMTTD